MVGQNLICKLSVLLLPYSLANYFIGNRGGHGLLQGRDWISHSYLLAYFVHACLERCQRWHLLSRLNIASRKPSPGKAHSFLKHSHVQLALVFLLLEGLSHSTHELADLRFA